MSFSYDVKQEISSIINYKNQELLKAELLGYMLSGNCIKSDNYLSFITENEFNIESLYKILFNLKVDYEPEISGKNYLANVKYTKELKDLNELLYSTNIDVLKTIIKGCFLGSGSITEPSKQSHLELVFNNEMNAKQVIEVAKEFDIDFKMIEKSKGKYLLYLKSNEQISLFLAIIGSNKGVLTFEDALVYKQMKNSINRKVNCETANLSKTVNAAVDQINDIKLIQKKNEFDKMEQDLKEIAMLRINNPDCSLKELGEKITPPLGKSGVSHRLRRIHELAESLRKDV